MRNALGSSAIVVAMMLADAGAAMAQATPAAPPEAQGGFDDIVVTARRREESAQTVPVSVVAFSGDMLAQRNVRQLGDLNVITPGFRYGAEGGKNNDTVILRGLGKTPLGEGVPAVVNYLADVALTGDGVNIPTYDIESIQVLKGPQGTLFGRNTLGGAVIVKPVAPNYEIGGYIKGEYGRFDYRTLEGAINLPIVDGKVAVRLAGQVRRQDGWVRNLDGGPDYSNTHSDAFRASLLLEPFEGFSNTTVFDYFKADEEPGGIYIYRHNRGAIPGFSELIDGQIAGYVQQQRAAGFYTSFGQSNAAAYRKLLFLANDTKVEVGAITFRNIFGYRESDNAQGINTAGTGPISLFGSPFTIRLDSSIAKRSYLTDEFQVLGTAFDDRLNFIVGLFYGHDKPMKAAGSRTVTFSFDPSEIFATSHVENRNKAVFGQIGYKVTDRLTFNAGIRYSWDKVSSCGGTFGGGTRFATFSECKDVAALNLTDGVGVVKNSGSAPSWTIGLDYKASDQLFFYVTSRRGYRGANVNTPLFETPFTTGGSGCSLGTTVVQCPDLRPFQKIDKETLTDVEVGAKWDWRAGDVRGRLNVAGFYSKYKGALQFFNIVGTGIPNGAPDTPTRSSIGVNAADLTIKGIEIDGSIIPTPGLTFSANAAFTDTNVDKLILPPIGGIASSKSDVTKFTPKFASTVAVNWVLPFRPFDSELVFNSDYYHTDKYGATSGQYLPGYDLVNARVSLNEISGTGLSLAFSVRNLFKEKYFTSPIVLLAGFPTNTVYVGEPRMWTLEAKFRF